MKRLELIGTRKLTTRSLRSAFNAARTPDKPVGGAYDAKTDWLHDNAHSPEKWPAIEDVMRETEERVIGHQMDQVYKLVKKNIGVKAAKKLAELWTMHRAK